MFGISRRLRILEPARPSLASACAAALLVAAACSSCAAAPSSAPASASPRPPAATGTAFPGGVVSPSGPVPTGFTRYEGTVTDSSSGEPIPGVCVYAGPAIGCPAPNLNSDVNGHWDFDFPTGPVWEFNFEHPLYEPINGIRGKSGTGIDVKLVKK